ncbi:MAG: hypothetical protein Q9175_008133 [Cornicularia normoerica]
MPSTTLQTPLQTAIATSAAPSLLEIPAALRNRIYALVVVKRFHGNPITFNRDTAPYWPESKDEPLQPSLSQVCRQLRDEVLPIYYGENLFGIHVRRNPDFVKYDRPTFLRWLDTVDEKYVSCVRNFRFDVHICGAKVQLHLLAGEPGYEVRRIEARNELRKGAVRAKVDALLGKLNEERDGERVCVEDIRRFEEKLFEWSRSNSYGGSIKLSRT